MRKPTQTEIKNASNSTQNEPGEIAYLDDAMKQYADELGSTYIL